MHGYWAVLPVVVIQGSLALAGNPDPQPATQPSSPAHPYLRPEQRPQKAKEAIDPSTAEKARYQAVWGLAISGYTRESAEVLGIIAADRGRDEALRECAAMGLINFTHSMPREVRTALQDKLYGALDAEKEKLQGGVIQLLVAWGDADRVRGGLGEKLRDHPMEVIVLKGISSRQTAVARLWEIYQQAAPAQSGNIALSRAWHAGEALIHRQDKRGIDILIECLVVSGDSADNTETFRQSRHNTFMHMASVLDNRFGYEAGGTWKPQLADAIPKMVEWWKANRQTWSFEEATSTELPSLEKGKALSKRQARVLAAKLANAAFAMQDFRHPGGKPVGKIEIAPESFNDVSQKDARWVLRMVRSAGPEAFVEFDSDGLDSKVVVNYAWK